MPLLMDQSIVVSLPKTTTPTFFIPLPVNQLLTVDNLGLHYAGADQPALSGLTFSLAPGQTLGLLGPNGAGKTTAISLLSTLRQPSTGTLSLGGISYYDNIRLARHKIGFIPQDIALYLKLSGRENLAYFASLYGLHGSKRHERVAHCLAFSRLEKMADRRVSTYSGGMKRRLNMAVALLHQPQLLLLDEPTVGIDAQSRQVILDSLQDLALAGTGLIYTSHYMEEIEQLCDTVIILDNGYTITNGQPQQLINQHQCRNLGELFIKLTGRELREG